MTSKSTRERDGVFKRGTWGFRLRVTDPATGKTKQVRTQGFNSREEAKEARDKARAALASGQYVAPARVTVAEYLRQWIELHSLRLKSSVEADYRARIEQYIIPRLGSIPLAHLRPSDVQRFYAELKTGGGVNGRPLSAKTVQNIGAVLKVALSHAVDVDQLLPRNPASRVRMPKGESVRFVTWTASEVQTFLEACQDHRLFAFFRLAAYTGARRSELLGLKWQDVDLEGKRMTVARVRVKGRRGVVEQTSTKGGDGRRTVTLDQLTLEVLKAHRVAQLEERMALGEAWTDTGYLFVQQDGQPIDPDTPSQLFTKVRERTGLRAQRLHDLRHFHATELLRAGVPLHVVADRLGHRDAMVTATIYAHVRSDQAQDVAELFARAVE